MHHCIAMPLSPSLHTNKTLVLPPSPYTLLLQSGRHYKSQGEVDVPRNVRQFRAVKASAYLVLPTFVYCDLDRVLPFRIGGNVPIKFESQDLGDQHTVLK